MKHYLWSHIILVAGVLLAGALYGLSAMAMVMVLIVLEVSLSFDNAVVNAKILETMSKKWQDRFITFGIPFAVFGMRFLFPILIVAIATGMGMIETLHVAIDNPEEYHRLLEANEHGIFSFGGAFLLMVFLGFFFDDDREEKWITILEDNPVTDKVSEVESIEVIIATSIGIALTWLTDDTTVAITFFSGMVLHQMIDSLDGLLSTNGIRAGIIGLLYLEVLDASFSFDGVIGAFAVTGNIVLIMIGLGIGAMYVRSMTLDFVERGTLTEYRYLEHGAHYAIGALAVIMFVKLFTGVPEVLTGLIGMSLITIAFLHSKYSKESQSGEQ